MSMQLTIYAKNLNKPGADIRAVCESLAPEDHLNVFHSLQDLSSWLISTRFDDAVLVLTAEDADELAELEPILPLFNKVKIVLLLPDREPDTIKIGYRLEPRFLGFLDSGLSQLKEILGYMVGRKRTAMDAD